MPSLVVAANQVKELTPFMVRAGSRTIGIYKFKGGYYAYENTCSHEGGPACEGELLGAVKCKVSAAGSRIDEFVDDDDMNIVCPWHGVRYDLRTGTCTSDTSLKLEAYRVLVDGDSLKIEY